MSLDGYFAVPRDPEPKAGAFNISISLRNELSRALKESPMSRAKVALGMTELLFGDAGDGEVTKAQLDSWTAPSRDAWRMPLEYLPALIQVTGAVWLLDHLAEKCGCRVLVGEQALFARFGTMLAMQKSLAGKIADLKKALDQETLDRLLSEMEPGE